MSQSKYKIYKFNLIKNLRISMSVKKKITYWAFVAVKWKRVAKVYFFELKRKGINIVLKKKVKNKILSSVKAKEFDQFYTTQKNVIVCMQSFKKFICVNKDKDIIIEPSAGCGSFINSINENAL